MVSLPASSGRLIYIWTSSLPGLRRAGSIRSFLLVIPMTRMLFKGLISSMQVRSWLTTLSYTWLLLFDPLFLQIASISSKMMQWKLLFDPLCYLCYLTASSNSFLIFLSLLPMFSSNIYGPLTILGLILRILLIYLAINVFPVHGGPYNSMPLMCFIPYSFIIVVGIFLILKILL